MQTAGAYAKQFLALCARTLWLLLLMQIQFLKPYQAKQLEKEGKNKYWELVKNGMGQKKKNKKKHFLGVLCLCNCVCVCVYEWVGVEKKKIELALRVWREKFESSKGKKERNGDGETNSWGGFVWARLHFYISWPLTLDIAFLIRMPPSKKKILFDMLWDWLS